MLDIVLYTGLDGTLYTFLDILGAHAFAIGLPVFMVVAIIGHTHTRLSRREWAYYLSIAAITGLILLYLTWGTNEYDTYRRDILGDHSWKRIATAVPIFGLFPVIGLVFWTMKSIRRKRESKKSPKDTSPIQFLSIQDRDVTVPTVENFATLLTLTFASIVGIPMLLIWGWFQVSTMDIFDLMRDLGDMGILMIILPLIALGALPVLFFRKKFLTKRLYQFRSDGIHILDPEGGQEIRYLSWSEIDRIACGVGPRGMTLSFQSRGRSIYTCVIGGPSVKPEVAASATSEMLDIFEKLPGTFSTEFDSVYFLRDVMVWRRNQG